MKYPALVFGKIRGAGVFCGDDQEVVVGMADGTTLGDLITDWEWIESHTLAEIIEIANK